MKILLTVVLTLAVLATGWLGFVFSGIYDISAVDPHFTPVRWAVETVKRNSIERRGAAIAPPVLDDPGLVRTGARQYAVLCTSCHDSPGRIRTLAALRMRPSPPPIGLAALNLSPGELFWVIRNGIKMTGMPSWGPAMSDDEIWAVVAFIEHVPTMSADEYRALLQERPATTTRSPAGGPVADAEPDRRADPAPATTVALLSAGEFEPASVTVAAGGTVEWLNVSDAPQALILRPRAASAPHSALLPESAATIRSGAIQPGGRFRYRFTHSGRYGMFRDPQDQSVMPGEVTVTAGATAPLR